MCTAAREGKGFNARTRSAVCMFEFVLAICHDRMEFSQFFLILSHHVLATLQNPGAMTKLQEEVSSIGLRQTVANVVQT
jgi:hypothetical protein